MVIVLYTASWCGPCKRVQAILERLATEMGFTLVVRDVAFMADHMETIRTVPTIIAGSRRIVGRIGEAALRAALEEELSRSEGSSGPGNSSSPC